MSGSGGGNEWGSEGGGEERSGGVKEWGSKIKQRKLGRSMLKCQVIGAQNKIAVKRLP